MDEIGKYFGVVVYLLLGMLMLPFFVRILVFSYGKAIKEYRRRYKDDE